MSATATMRRPLGIISFKGLLESIDKAIDGVKSKIENAVDDIKDKIDTNKAIKQYEEIRKELISMGTGYAEKKYIKLAKKAEGIKELTENDKIHISHHVDIGKDKEDGKNRRRAELSIGAGLVEAGFEAITGESIVGTVLSVFGITAPPATTIITCALLGATSLYSLYKLNKTRGFTRAEKREAEYDFKKKFTPLVEDVKKLCDELEKEKDKDIAMLKNRTDKNNPEVKHVTAKEFKKIFAKRALEIIGELNLKTLRVNDVAEAFNIEEEVKAFEDELKEQEKETQQEPEAKSDEKPQAQTKEEQERLLQEEKMQEQQAQSEERENG